MPSNQPNALVREQRIKQVLHQAGKNEKERKKAENHVSYVDLSRNSSVVIDTVDLADAIKKTPGSIPESPKPEVFFNMAKNLMVKQQFEDAIKCLKLAQYAIKPADPHGPDLPISILPDVLCALARCYLKLGQFQTCLSLVQLVLIENPRCISAIWIKAESLYNTCDFERAMALFYRGLRLAPTHVGFKHGLLKCRSTVQSAVESEQIFCFPGVEDLLNELTEMMKDDPDSISKYLHANQIQKSKEKFSKQFFSRKKLKSAQKKNMKGKH